VLDDHRPTVLDLATMSQDQRNTPYVLFAVMEQGSAWPTCIQHCRRVTPDSIVIAQDIGETPPQLAERVRRRVRALTAEGRVVGTGVLAAAEEAPQDASSARVQIALTLLQSMRRGTDEGKLCLVGSGRMQPHAREQLMALTGMLMSELSGPPPTIDVRFDAEAPNELQEACPHAGNAAAAVAAG
jgi:hypothetical protein